MILSLEKEVSSIVLSANNMAEKSGRRTIEGYEFGTILVVRLSYETESFVIFQR